MSCNPGGDAKWDVVLAHRPDGARTAVAERFVEAGITPGDVSAVLADMGDCLHATAATGNERWAERFGGPLAVALLAAEVSALAAHLNSRASAVRAIAMDSLLDDYSAVTIATRLGVSRQKVYDIARGSATGPFIEHALGGSHA